MSMTKRALDGANEIAERNLTINREKCGCYFNWDDKFRHLCDEHQLQWGDEFYHEMMEDQDAN